MDYAIEVLKKEAYTLQKSRDNLQNTLDRLRSRNKPRTESEGKELIDNYILDFDDTKRHLEDKIDSLYEAIRYLSEKRGD